MYIHQKNSRCVVHPLNNSFISHPPTGNRSLSGWVGVCCTLALGADAVVDYHDANWIEKICKLGDNHLQHTLDTISVVETTKSVIPALSPKGGHVLCIQPRIAREIGLENNPEIEIENTIFLTVFERAFKFVELVVTHA
jgi:hypothetical protein